LMVLGGMDPFVLLQILRALEGLAADLARMRLERSVYCICQHRSHAVYPQYLPRR
jgi:hypothetical protein